MAKYYISYNRYKLDQKGNKIGVIGSAVTVEATSDFMALEIIKGKHPGFNIEVKSIKQK
ncbi:hypothetical protein ACN9JZ_03545 [Aliarcobacter butzleri]|uniref:hypothetical protein n=1 Tax=Aliarcobacter butzleri TaxID=28197 RepID=UPI003AF60FC4